VADSQQELVTRAVGGDDDALAALLEAHGPVVRGRLRIDARWRPLLDPADVMQVTYLEAFLRIGQLRQATPEAFEAWLTRIAEHNLTDAIRGLERDKRPDSHRRLEPEDAEQSLNGLLDHLQAGNNTASRAAMSAEASQIVEAAIDRLPETYREVVRRYDLAGERIEAVATALGRSPGAVYMLRSRAHDRLREVLGSQSRYFSNT